MRFLITFFCLTFLMSLTTSAQILEKETNMSLGVQTGNEVILDDVEVDDAVDLWEDYFKEEFDEKVKRNRKADEYYVTGVRINKIFSVSNIDVYTKFDERGSSTVMTMWVDLGMAFVNSKDYPAEYKGIMEIMEDFRIHARTFAVNQEYEKAEEQLDDMKDELNKLEKKNVKLHEKIADYEQRIVEARDDISKNLVEQDETRIAIDKQVEVLKQIQVRLESIKKQ